MRKRCQLINVDVDSISVNMLPVNYYNVVTVPVDKVFLRTES